MFKNFLREMWPPAPTFLPKDYPDLTGKVALVTGSSAGVGLELARLLAMKNCHVIMGIRSKEKGEKAIEKILKEIGENDGQPVGKIDIVTFDLADLTTIKAGAEQIEALTDKLNIIIHNAGVMVPPLNSKSVQGYELQWGTNVIGPFLLQKYLDPLFLKDNTSMKRLVWVSSLGHTMSAPGGINWDDLNNEASQGDFPAYFQSKAGDVLLAGIWPKHHQDEVSKQNIVCVSAHPGLLRSELSRSQSWFMQNFEYYMGFECVYGAYTECYALLSPDLTNSDNGSYIVPWGVPGELRDDVKDSITNGNGDRLWQYLEDEVKSYY